MYLLKFRKADFYALNDILNNMLSFGSYSKYYDQNELQATYKLSYLRKKYNDNSLTKSNVNQVLLSKCFNRYFLSSFAHSNPKNVKRYKHLWSKYSNNNGLVIIYALDKIRFFALGNNNFIFNKVTYKNTPYDITDVLDAFLESAIGYDSQSLISEKFLSLLIKRKLDQNIVDYLFQKTDYCYSFENEYRLIYLPKEIYKRKYDYISVKFIKPTRVIILENVDSIYKQLIYSICKTNNIEYEEISLIGKDL